MKRDYDKFHEEEVIILKTTTAYTVNALRAYLLSLHFTEIDDFYVLDRMDKHPIWQTMSIAHINVFFDTKKINLIDDDFWNKLAISYLFSTVPFEFIDKFLDVTFNIAEKFNLQVEYNGSLCNKNDLVMIFHEYREDVQQSLDGEPGS